MGSQYFLLTGHIAPLTQVHGVVIPAVEVTGIDPRIAETDILGINQSVSIPVILTGRTSLGLNILQNQIFSDFLTLVEVSLFFWSLLGTRAQLSSTFLMPSPSMSSSQRSPVPADKRSMLCFSLGSGLSGALTVVINVLLVVVWNMRTVVSAA